MNFRSSPFVRFSLYCLFLLFSISLGAQELPKNWFLLDYTKNGYPGVSAEKAYTDHIKGKKGEKVIVAILDSGVDYKHEDLKGVMWVNPREIPDNKIDDDKNGYTDDIYGWNFIGGTDGRNVAEDTYEITRLYAHYRKKFENADPAKLRGKDKKEYDKYLEYKKEVLENQQEAKEQFDGLMETMGKITTSLIVLDNHMQGKEFNQENIKAIDAGSDMDLMMGKNIALQMYGSGVEINSSADLRNGVLNQFLDMMKYHRTKSEAGYNPDFDPRYLVGDNYANSNEKYYGNGNAKGPDSFHGTHVAGIVAANRTNNIGIRGIARDVDIMSVRCVPDGDERDKDVANAIRYAVDNGASIINMSFGKGHSWDKKVVDDAVKYAAKNDVLLIHAAGNSSQDNDVTPNFPNAVYEKSGWFSPKRAKNWIEVGALAPTLDEKAAARFSNYGKKTVDIFAPGVQIYSTIPEGDYDFANGTSMASPAVAGVAAMIRSQYPTLTAIQVKDIIMKSATPITIKVIKPGTKDLVPFTELCVSGGYIDAYKALELASKTKGKKKRVAPRA
jgi:cell wall-associated protease